MVVTSGINSHYILNRKEEIGSLCMFSLICLLPQCELGEDFSECNSISTLKKITLKSLEFEIYLSGGVGSHLCITCKLYFSKVSVSFGFSPSPAPIHPAGFLKKKKCIHLVETAEFDFCETSMQNHSF